MSKCHIVGYHLSRLINGLADGEGHLIVVLLSYECQCSDSMPCGAIGLVLVWFDALRPSQQLWSCRDGQLTKSHFSLASFTKRLTSTSCTCVRL